LSNSEFDEDGLDSIILDGIPSWTIVDPSCSAMQCWLDEQPIWTYIYRL
jgi:hypothetical protein